MYFMDLKLIAPLKRLNLIVETYPVWCLSFALAFKIDLRVAGFCLLFLLEKLERAYYAMCACK